MPNQCHSGWNGTPWHRCDICDQDNPVSNLRRQPGLQRGILVCNKCWDTPLTYDRDVLIEDILAAGQDQEAQVADILQEPMSDGSTEF